WYPLVLHHAPHVPIFLLGCKSDMKAELYRKSPTFVTTEEAKKAALQIGAIDALECTAMRGVGKQSVYQRCLYGESPSQPTQTYQCSYKRTTLLLDSSPILPNGQLKSHDPHRLQTALQETGKDDAKPQEEEAKKAAHQIGAIDALECAIQLGDSARKVTWALNDLRRFLISDITLLTFDHINGLLYCSQTSENEPAPSGNEIIDGPRREANVMGYRRDGFYSGTSTVALIWGTLDPLLPNTSFDIPLGCENSRLSAKSQISIPNTI
ncbi:7140_t:CDS:2, partial [Acaulospora colombiana]